MHCKPWRFVLLCGVLALSLTILDGQRPETHPEICHITVQDKSGHPVTNLNQSAFTVWENGVKQEIRFFRNEDVPVSMGLLIDNGGGMRVKRSSVEAAALALVKDSRPDDEVFVVNFTGKVYFDNPNGKDFVTDREEIADALTRIDARGGSAIREAVVKSIEWMKKAHKDKHVLVVVTGGVDDASYVKLEDVVRSAQQSDVVVYAVGLLADEEKTMAREARRLLSSPAEATGGEAFFPDPADVDRVARQVARDIRGQYMIGYQPSNAALDGTFRKIKVAVKAAGNPTARTRTGYYATADQVSSPTTRRDK